MDVVGEQVFQKVEAVSWGGVPYWEEIEGMDVNRGVMILFFVKRRASYTSGVLVLERHSLGLAVYKHSYCSIIFPFYGRSP